MVIVSVTIFHGCSECQNLRKQCHDLANGPYYTHQQLLCPGKLCSEPVKLAECKPSTLPGTVIGTRQRVARRKSHSRPLHV